MVVGPARETDLQALAHGGAGAVAAGEVRSFALMGRAVGVPEAGAHTCRRLVERYELGLALTSFSDDVGWNQVATGPVDLRFSTVMSPDDKPCIAVDFAVTPQPNYSQSY